MNAATKTRAARFANPPTRLSVVRLAGSFVVAVMVLSACGSSSSSGAAPAPSRVQAGQATSGLYRLRVTYDSAFSPGVTDVEWYDVATGNFRADVSRGRLHVRSVTGSSRAVITSSVGSEVAEGMGSFFQLRAGPNLIYSPASLAFAAYRHSRRWVRAGLTVRSSPATEGRLLLDVSSSATGEDGRRIHYSVLVNKADGYSAAATNRLFSTTAPHTIGVARDMAVGTTPLHGHTQYWLGRTALGLTARSANEEWAARMPGRPEQDIYRTSYRVTAATAGLSTDLVQVSSETLPLGFPRGKRHAIVTSTGEKATVWTVKSGPCTVEIGTAVVDFSGVTTLARQLQVAKLLRPV